MPNANGSIKLMLISFCNHHLSLAAQAGLEVMLLTILHILHREKKDNILHWEKNNNLHLQKNNILHWQKNNTLQCQKNNILHWEKKNILHWEKKNVLHWDFSLSEE